MIRYLEPEEKQLCRPLWEEAFPEDTREFLDNYFERKMKENRVLAALDGGLLGRGLAALAAAGQHQAKCCCQQHQAETSVHMAWSFLL